MFNDSQKFEIKILVTGGAGFIGSHLVDRLIEEGYKVIVIDNLSTGKEGNLNSKAKFYEIDICNPLIVKIFQIERPNYVFHYAAQSKIQNSIEDPLYDARVNILGSLNIFENCKNFGVKKIVFASTGAIYGNAKIIPTSENYPPSPISPYSITKPAIENYLNYYWKMFGLPYVCLRYSNVFGPRQDPKSGTGVITIFFDKIFKGEQLVIYGDGNQTRDFLYVDDAVEASILSLRKNITGIFNVGTGKETSINTILRKLEEITNYPANKTYKPPRLAEQKRSCLNIGKIKKKISWQPRYTLDAGLKKMLEYYKKFYKHF